MTHTHYIATPISEKPEEEGAYFCLDKQGNRFTSWWQGEHWLNDTTVTWLKPYTETGAVDEGKFAEWAFDAGWNFNSSDRKWFLVLSFDEIIYKTTSELLEIFKAETQKI